jgi:CRP-like cAMP-binding protein
MNINDISNILPGTPRRFKAKTPVIYQGEIPRSGFFIQKGIIKSYTLQMNGEEQIAAFFGPGDFFPLPWLFGKTTSSIYYHETLEACEVISVTRADTENYILANPQLKDYLLDKLVSDQAAYLMRITALEQSRAVEKILFTLYYLLYQFGDNILGDDYLIDIKLTHATIASLVGLTRETTATELNKLKRKGVLSYSKKLYRVNRKKLEKTMGEDSFAELVSVINPR